MLKFKSDRKANTPSCFASGKGPVACMAANRLPLVLEVQVNLPTFIECFSWVTVALLSARRTM